MSPNSGKRSAIQTSGPPYQDTAPSFPTRRTLLWVDVSYFSSSMISIYTSLYSQCSVQADHAALRSGDHSMFDLLDSKLFNDVPSVTSVKSYFGSFSNSPLTFVLHGEFMFTFGIKVAMTKRNPRTNPSGHNDALRKRDVVMHAEAWGHTEDGVGTPTRTVALSFTAGPTV